MQYPLFHNPEKHRYEFHLVRTENPAETRADLRNNSSIDASRNVAYVEYEYDADRNAYRLTHTIVPRDFEGQGIAAALVGAVLAEFRQRGVRIIPECSYVVRYVERHPEWQDLVVEAEA